uniref:Uncharacterized protein n=1 Tax=Anguilla anguilla TaxID=7936 RepID=A0A0E9PQG8_ANGAN
MLMHLFILFIISLLTVFICMEILCGLTLRDVFCLK